MVRHMMHMTFSRNPFGGSYSISGVALGTGRVDAIILHLVVPAMMLRARLSGNRSFATRARAMALVLSPPPSNTLTRMMERDLLRGRKGFRGAVMHQGLMQLWKKYCRKRGCGQCPFFRVTMRERYPSLPAGSRRRGLQGGTTMTGRCGGEIRRRKKNRRRGNGGCPI
jgi:hypothetical protein